MAAVSESWQNGYCTGLENRRPQGLTGSNPVLSAGGYRFSLTTPLHGVVRDPFGRILCSPQIFFD
jgi:hypothetical protein